MSYTNNNEWSPHFLSIPKQVFENTNLNVTDWVVYAAVYFFHNLSEGKCFASNYEIGRIIHKSGRTVSASLTKLENNNCLKRTFVRGRDGGLHRLQITPLIMVSVLPMSDGEIPSAERTEELYAL